MIISDFSFSKKFLNDSYVKEIIFDYKNLEIRKIYLNYTETYKVKTNGCLEHIKTSYEEKSKIISDFDFKNREIIIKNK